MEPYVFFAVLAAAMCHASWNALLKIRLEPLTSISLIMAAGGLCVLPFIAVVSFPVPSAWPFLLASIVIHLAYYLTLTEAYRTGDLGQVYPIARGAAPLMTAAGASALLGEHLDFWSIVGIVMLTCGVALLSLRGGQQSKPFDGRAVGFAMLTALAISAYTLVDGQGARQGPSPGSYIVWLFALDGLFMLVFIAYWRGTAVVGSALRLHWRMLAVGGALSALAYAIALWAMTLAPIAMVAAVRETSVLFAALIGVVALKEQLRPVRIVAALVVVSGLMVLRLH